jgi:hypothetical protein
MSSNWFVSKGSLPSIDSFTHSLALRVVQQSWFIPLQPVHAVINPLSLYVADTLAKSRRSRGALKNQQRLLPATTEATVMIPLFQVCPEVEPKQVPVANYFPCQNSLVRICFHARPSFCTKSQISVK